MVKGLTYKFQNTERYYILMQWYWSHGHQSKYIFDFVEF